MSDLSFLRKEERARGVVVWGCERRGAKEGPTGFAKVVTLV